MYTHNLWWVTNKNGENPSRNAYYLAASTIQKILVSTKDTLVDCIAVCPFCIIKILLASTN